MQGGQASRRCAYPETLMEPVVGLLSWYAAPPCTHNLQPTIAQRLMPSLLVRALTSTVRLLIWICHTNNTLQESLHASGQKII